MSPASHRNLVWNWAVASVWVSSIRPSCSDLGELYRRSNFSILKTEWSIKRKADCAMAVCQLVVPRKHSSRERASMKAQGFVDHNYVLRYCTHASRAYNAQNNLPLSRLSGSAALQSDTPSVCIPADIALANASPMRCHVDPPRVL